MINHNSANLMGPINSINNNRRESILDPLTEAINDNHSTENFYL